jgi:predicted nucleotidyltransferase
LVYRNENGFREELQKLAKICFDPTTCFLAHFGLAKGHYKKYIEGQPHVETKVYLYTVRAIGACWYILGRKSCPWVNFAFEKEWSGTIQSEIESVIEKLGRGLESPRE